MGEVRVFLSHAVFLKVGISLSKKIVLFNSMKVLKNDEKLFLFHLKSLKFSSWLLGHVEKMTSTERKGEFQNLWRYNLVNKWL